MPRFVRRALAVTSALLALGVVGVVGVGPAAAEEPVDVSGQIDQRLNQQFARFGQLGHRQFGQIEGRILAAVGLGF